MVRTRQSQHARGDECTIQGLSDDLMIDVFRLLPDGRALARTSSVCQRWKGLVCTHGELLWKKMLADLSHNCTNAVTSDGAIARMQLSSKQCFIAVWSTTRDEPKPDLNADFDWFVQFSPKTVYGHELQTDMPVAAKCLTMKVRAGIGIGSSDYESPLSFILDEEVTFSFQPHEYEIWALHRSTSTAIRVFHDAHYDYLDENDYYDDHGTWVRESCCNVASDVVSCWDSDLYAHAMFREGTYDDERAGPARVGPNDFQFHVTHWCRRGSDWETSFNVFDWFNALQYKTRTRQMAFNS